MPRASTWCEFIPRIRSQLLLHIDSSCQYSHTLTYADSLLILLLRNKSRYCSYCLKLDFRFYCYNMVITSASTRILRVAISLGLFIRKTKVSFFRLYLSAKFSHFKLSVNTGAEDSIWFSMTSGNTEDVMTTGSW